MIAKFYKNNSDERAILKDLIPLSIANSSTMVPDTDCIPRLTGADASVTASSEYPPRYFAWSAFSPYINGDWYNPDWDSVWRPADNEDNAWIQFEVPAGIIITSLRIICGSTYAGDFTCNMLIEGSNDGLAYSSIDTVSITGDLHAATTCNYSFANETYYKYIRLTFDEPLFASGQPNLFITSINASGYHLVTTPLYDLDVIFKQDESRLNPSLILQHNAVIEGANYCRVGDRYYYITDLTYSQQRIVLALHEDVLMTYHDEILNLGVILDRQENEGNPYLKDSEMPVEAKRSVQCKIFPKGFSGDTYILATTGA